jgi:hypothetical protein
VTAIANLQAARRPGLTTGTPVWCVTGGIPAGGRIAWQMGLHTRMVSLCVFGAHFPRQVPVKNLTILDDGTAPMLGLCPECLGFGTGADLPPAVILRSGDVPEPCWSCGGTGRNCLKLITTAAVSGVPVMALLLHGARRLDGCAPGMCVSCGFPVSDPQAHPGAMVTAG